MNYKINQQDVPTITSRGGKINILISPKSVGSSHLVMGYSELDVNDQVEPHVHDYSEEAFYVIAGQGRIYMGKVTEYIDFKEGDSILVPKGTVHWIQNTGHQALKVIFSVSPLAPSPELGHRNIQIHQLNEETTL